MVVGWLRIIIIIDLTSKNIRDALEGPYGFDNNYNNKSNKFYKKKIAQTFARVSCFNWFFVVGSATVWND